MAIFTDVLGGLTRLPVGRNRRVSSNEQPNWNDGNFDMTRLTPGQEFTLPVLEGPGVINHIWFTSHAGGVNELNALSLRIYWDDQKTPGVEAPLGDFFAVGQKPAIVDSFPVQVSASGSLTCYWRMPFAKSARIVVTNDNPNRSTGLYWVVDWLQLDELPPDTAYFYAKYRQEYPAVMGCDYLIADLEGRGQYVGTVMSVTMAQDGWFGEGDDFFYIDGEDVPSLQGTGSEDYFNDAWGFRTRTSPWFGQPRWQGFDAGDSGICYRWHVLDAVGFRKSLKVTIEHKGNRPNAEEAWYIERPDFISSIAYWYQLGEPKPFGNLPSYPDRRVPWIDYHLVKTFQRVQTTGAGEVTVQAVGFFGGRPSLQWKPGEPNTTLTLPFEVAETGRYAVRLSAFTAPNLGTYDVQIDGKTVLSAVDFSAKTSDDCLLGTHELQSGAHTLSFRNTSSEKEGALALEMLRLLKLPAEVDRKVKTHNEAHFIRLAIGRAVYAYRLAYDTLPESLDALVQSGLMSDRYLSDENRQPLTSKREGEFLVVTGKAWTHRWLGLDARR